MNTTDSGYYVVIFSSTLRSAQLDEDSEYARTARRMAELAAQQPGFLSMESVRQGLQGITVSCWQDLAAIARWRQHPEHQAAIERGRQHWYEDYHLRICRVEKAYRGPARDTAVPGDTQRDGRG